MLWQVLTGKFKQFGLGGFFLNPGGFLLVLEEADFGSSTGSTGGLVKNNNFSHPSGLSGLEQSPQGKNPMEYCPSSALTLCSECGLKYFCFSSSGAAGRQDHSSPALSPSLSKGVMV